MISMHELEQKARQRLVEKLGEREGKQTFRLLKEDLSKRLTGGNSSSYEALLLKAIPRILAGEPVQYITGIADFYGMQLGIEAGVLIPRPETEELVSWALEEVNLPEQKQLRILDIGTGSGCIALAIKKNMHAVGKVMALDISRDALKVAKMNAQQLMLDVEFLQTDFLVEKNWSGLGTFDMIISNPPYIAMEERRHMDEPTLRFEPSMALFSPLGSSPQIFYHKIAAFSKQYLLPGGHIFLELNEFRARESEDIFRDAGFQTEVKKDMQGKERMLKARL